MFLILLSPSKVLVDVFAPVIAHLVFFFSIALKLSFTSAGILQLILLLNSDSHAIFEFLGIDSIVIWKIRVIHAIIALFGVIVSLINNSMPIFSYRLIRTVSVPESTWIVSTSLNSLVFVSFNLIVSVQLCKIYNNWRLIRTVNDIKPA